MYFTIGAKKATEILYLLAKSQSEEIFKSKKDVKEGILKFISSVQPNLPLNKNEDMILQDVSVKKVLMENFLTDSHLNDLTINHDINFTPREDGDKLKIALREIEREIPELYEVFTLAIHSIFLASSKSQAGGSVSSALGVIWISPRENWSTNDYIELLIHELTHNLLFYDEYLNLHYSSYTELNKKHNFATSSILKKLRPMDKAFHSLVVASEILLFRNSNKFKTNGFKIHPETNKLLKQFNTTFQDIHKIKDRKFLSNRFRKVLNLTYSEVSKRYHKAPSL